MKVKKLCALFISLIIITGCAPTDNQQSKGQSPPVDMTKLSTKASINQEKSNRAKDKLMKDENVTHVYGVNSTDKLVIAIEIPHMKRFRLKKIEKQLMKKMKKEFPKLDVHLSTDQKIILELQKLEGEINSSSISKKKLEKRLQQIIKLSKKEA